MKELDDRPERKPSAAYVRMSTEHQQYSLDNQLEAIREYADRNGFEIIDIYSDGGKSGLSIQGRDELSRLINDARKKDCAFISILVYDISRWGRFQDADEGAHYEYLCRKAGLSVHYCAEQFENDGSPTAAIMKSVKRAMAGEYSRELSSKVFRGACTLIRLGYKQGGTAGFGLRRMLVDQNGQPKMIMKVGEQKSLQTDRVILVAGPDEECQTVTSMYTSFVAEGKSETEIAKELNGKGILTDLGRIWTRATVHQVLTNEKYIGNNIYNRTSFKLKKRHVSNTPDTWVRADGAFQAIISHEVFHAAREIILARSVRFTDAEMLGKLREIFDHYGQISGILIDERDDAPSSSAYRHRFGSLVTAYRLIGYSAGIDYSFIEVNRRLRQRHPGIVETVILEIASRGARVSREECDGLINVNDEFSIAIVLCRHFSTSSGASRWIVRLEVGRRPDVTIAVRMDAANEGVRDYYILPAIDMTWQTLRVAEDNGLYLDAYRFETLDPLMAMMPRTSVHLYEN